MIEIILTLQYLYFEVFTVNVAQNNNSSFWQFLNHLFHAIQIHREDRNVVATNETAKETKLLEKALFARRMK